jgi:hypothetical protein
VADLIYRHVATVNGFDLHEPPGGALVATDAGSKMIVGSVWGPAADGTDEWFASRWLKAGGPIRVADRAAAIEYITTEASV